MIRKRGERKIPFISHFLLHAMLVGFAAAHYTLYTSYDGDGRYLPTTQVLLLMFLLAVRMALPTSCMRTGTLNVGLVQEKLVELI